ncbi:MAG: ABC transporter permease, partial [Paraburkholderia nemoris]
MSTPSAPAGHPRTFTDRLPSLAEIGPLIALLLACGFFISQSNRF